MLSITCLLYLAAFIIAIFSAAGKAPLWVSIILICIGLLLGCLPVR